jgi:hypothetical protein
MKFGIRVVLLLYIDILIVVCRDGDVFGARNVLNRLL